MKDLRTVIGKIRPVYFLLLIAPLFFDFTYRAIPPATAIATHSSTSSAGFSTHSAFFSPRSAGFFGIYDHLQLNALALSRDAWQRAVEGFLALQSAGQLANTDVLTIIDFSLPSTKKRLFVIDMLNGRLLFHTLVAHGRNSGKLIATKFSNRNNSYMSSLGFYLTGQPFTGRHGYSLRLEGMEKGWNDHVLQRAIIMHPAYYVSERYILQCGYLGRSEGCPAIPENLHTAIIDQIKGGSCLFVYAPDKDYLDRGDPFS